MVLTSFTFITCRHCQWVSPAAIVSEYHLPPLSVSITCRHCQWVSPAAIVSEYHLPPLSVSITCHHCQWVSPATIVSEYHLPPLSVSMCMWMNLECISRVIWISAAFYLLNCVRDFKFSYLWRMAKDIFLASTFPFKALVKKKTRIFNFYKLN